jgi:CDGSH-type Zn-finger protein
MPEDPKPTDIKPISMDLEPGTYWWCSCGLTSHAPFCDGSHKGTGLQPKKLEITEKKTVTLCQCKQTGDAPFCDGSHRRI